MPSPSIPPQHRPRRSDERSGLVVAAPLVRRADTAGVPVAGAAAARWRPLALKPITRSAARSCTLAFAPHRMNTPASRRMKRLLSRARLNISRSPARPDLTLDRRRGIAAVDEFFAARGRAREIGCADAGALERGEQGGRLRVAGWVGMGGGSAMREATAVAGRGHARFERTVERGSMGRERGAILVEELMAMGLEAQGAGVARRGSSGMNGAWGGSKTADNSLALAVNGKRCGECQCVTMNHGTTNLAVARSGGGS